MTIRGRRSRWNDENIREARKNHQAALENPDASEEQKAWAREVLEALDKAELVEEGN